MNAVFGKMPNKKNLQLFFQNPVIKYFWWEQPCFKNISGGFFQSDEVK